MYSYELTFWLISIENSDKQESKNTMSVEISHYCGGQPDSMRHSYAFNKIWGVQLSIHFLRRVVLLGIIFLDTELNKPTFLRDEMFFYWLFATSKAKHYTQ